MKDFVTDDGEVIRYKDAISAARTALSSFKFQTLETVRADPRLSKAPCEAVMGVFVKFLSLDEKTLKRKPVYASMITILSQTTISSRATVRKAKALLIEFDYLFKLGSTSHGCDLYEVRNPHFEYVQMHIHEKRVKLSDDANEDRGETRRRSSLQQSSGSTDDPAENQQGVNECTRRGSTDDPNIVENYRRRNSIEESQSPSPVYGEEDRADIPFPVPSSADELEAMLTELCSGSPLSQGVIALFRRKLLEGTLTPSIVDDQRKFAERFAA